MSLLLTTIGAVLTTLLGVMAGSALSNRSQQRQWARDRKADACSQVLRESSNIVIELAKLNGKRVNPAPGENAIPAPVVTPLDWRPWNEALAMVCLVADHEIVEAALAVDAELWPAHIKIKHGLTEEGDWRGLRDLIEVKRRDFVNAARKHLAPPGPRLQRLTAQPPAADPIWKHDHPKRQEEQGSLE